MATATFTGTYRDEIMIGAYTVTKVCPDMVRIYDERRGNAVTVKEIEMADVLQMMVDGRIGC